MAIIKNAKNITINSNESDSIVSKVYKELSTTILIGTYDKGISINSMKKIVSTGNKKG